MQKGKFCCLGQEGNIFLLISLGKLLLVTATLQIEFIRLTIALQCGMVIYEVQFR